MMKGKLLVVVAFVVMLSLFFAPAKAWPSDDQGGWYFVNTITGDEPVVDGEIDGDEWLTGEEFFKDTYGSLSYPEQTESGLAISLVMLVDSAEENLFVKVTWEAGVVDDVSPNSIGLAFANQEIQGMQSTWDRKIAFYDGNGGMNNSDLWGCQNVPVADQDCSGTNLQPGVPDTDVEFTAEFGFDDDTGKAFFEFKIPMNPTDLQEDLALDIGDSDNPGTYMKIVVNPFDNMAKPNVGHGGVGSSILFLQGDTRCFFCPPESGGEMDSNSFVFNAFFGLMISGIFLSFIISRRSPSIAERLWKVDVTEDMAKESVIMEMAYYNSNFLSLLTTIFFTIYAAIGFLYGFWADWGVQGMAVNGIPLLIGLFTTYDLIRTNENPLEMEHRPGTDVNDAGRFWVVPTFFLAITLLMLVFIGIDVIS